MSKARDLSNFISDATVDASEIADLAVTHAKLHTDMNLSSKTLTFAANQISGNSVDGGVISNFASTGIDDNASATAVTILSDGKVGVGYTSPNEKLHVNGHIEASAGYKLASHPVLDYTSFDGGYSTRLGSTGTSTLNATQIFAGGSVQATFKGGNVGIGTDSPSVKLHVDGAGSQPEIRVSQNSTYFTDYGVNHIDVNGPNDLRFLMGGAEKVRITSDGYIQANSQSQIRLTLGNVGTPGTNTANWIRGTGNSLGLNAASDNIHFEIGGNEKFKITASGGAVFNNVQDINQNFTVKSSGNAASIFIDGNGGHISVNRGNFSSNPTGSKLNVFGDGEVLRLDGTGGASRTLRFRGVSTVNPGIIIADGSLEITNEDANTSIALMSERDIIIKTTKSNSTAGHAKFYSHNTEIMRIDGQHNRVGIGVTSPTSKLHVDGTVHSIFGYSMRYLKTINLTTSYQDIVATGGGSPSEVGWLIATSSENNYHQAWIITYSTNAINANYLGGSQGHTHSLDVQWRHSGGHIQAKKIYSTGRPLTVFMVAGSMSADYD